MFLMFLTDLPENKIGLAVNDRKDKPKVAISVEI